MTINFPHCGHLSSIGLVLLAWVQRYIKDSKKAKKWVFDAFQTLKTAPRGPLKGGKTARKQKMLPFCFFMLILSITFAPAKVSKTLNLTQ
jgi:hypothetical protein